MSRYQLYSHSCQDFFALIIAADILTWRKYLYLNVRDKNSIKHTSMAIAL